MFGPICQMKLLTKRILKEGTSTKRNKFGNYGDQTLLTAEDVKLKPGKLSHFLNGKK